mmetsp:Transcript_115755/g.327351  ORF Transcript_115755/g.327351 Transcript_115755/m.327351 type:complete len:271 (-) Transcript_115755:40-852(-)
MSRRSWRKRRSTATTPKTTSFATSLSVLGPPLRLGSRIRRGGGSSTTSTSRARARTVHKRRAPREGGPRDRAATAARGQALPIAAAAAIEAAKGRNQWNCCLLAAVLPTPWPSPQATVTGGSRGNGWANCDRGVAPRRCQGVGRAGRMPNARAPATAPRRSPTWTPRANAVNARPGDAAVGCVGFDFGALRPRLLPPSLCQAPKCQPAAAAPRAEGAPSTDIKPTRSCLKTDAPSHKRRPHSVGRTAAAWRARCGGAAARAHGVRRGRRP